MLPVLQPNTLFFFVSKSTADNMQSVTSNAVANAINGLIKIKDVRINFSSLTWTNYSQGGYYANVPVSNYLTDYKTILGITTRYWTRLDCRGFYLGFDSEMSNISILAETHDSNAYINVRIVYI